MDANLTLSTGSGANPLAIGEGVTPAEPRPSAGQTMLGKEFANLMRDLLPGSERQAFAAEGQTASVKGLQTLALGQQFAVITSRAPQPDTPSLVAFAKMQGLDDAAVRALFGNLPDMAQGISPGPSRPPDGPAASDGTEAKAPTPVEPDSAALLAGATPLAASWAAHGVATAQALAATLPLPHNAGAALQQASIAAVPPVGATRLPMTAAAPPDATHTAQGSGIEPLKATLLSSGAQVVFMQIPDAARPLALPDQQKPTETPPPAPDAHDAVCMRLMPVWENITRNLAKTAGQEVRLPWASVVAGWVESRNDVFAGELELQWNAAAGQQGTPAAAPDAPLVAFSSNGSHAGNVARSVLELYSPSSATGPATDRSAEISQLADRLGQALSERLQEQLSRGEWKLELHLKPAHLGKLSVELGMNGGSLDALFKTDNALTRELIAQSVPRLRESLTQAGMAVANVWVNSGGQQQTGGNPTPRFYRPEVSEATVPAEDPKGTTTVLARTKSRDGWDELA